MNYLTKNIHLIKQNSQHIPHVVLHEGQGYESCI